MIRSLVFFSVLIAPIYSFATALNSVNTQINLQNEIEANRKDLNVLRSKLSDLDNQYWGNQKKLLNAVNVKRNIELMMDGLSEKLTNINNQVAKHNQQAPKVTQMALLSKLYQDTPEGMVVQFATSSELIRMLKALEKQQTELKSIKDEYTALNARFIEYVQIEKELAEMMGHVSENKKELVDAMEESRRRDKELSAKKVVVLKKSIPEKSYTDSEICGTSWRPFKNGVEFDLKESNASCTIKVPRDGKVVYKGNLSTYGDVLIVEHESEKPQKLRSIFVGKIETQAEKNSFYKTGQVIGKALMGEGSSQYLYYELREGKTPQSYLTYMNNSKIDNDKNLVQAQNNGFKRKI